MIFCALTSDGPRWRCWKPEPERALENPSLKGLGFSTPSADVNASGNYVWSLLLHKTFEPSHEKNNKMTPLHTPDQVLCHQALCLLLTDTLVIAGPTRPGFGENSLRQSYCCHCAVYITKWAPSSEFVSSSIPSWQISTAHAQPFRGARDLAFCLKVPLDSLLVWASSGGSGETARMRRLAWTFAARIGYKYQIRLTRSK